MRKLLVSALALTGVSLLGLSAAAEAIELKLAHGSPRLHPNAKHADMLAQRIGEVTDGEVEVTVFGDQQLGDDKDMIQLVQSGTVEMGYASSVNFPLTLNKVAFDALQLPGLIKDYEHLIRVYSSPVASKLLDSLEDQGLKGLCFSEGGLRHFLSTREPIESVADFDGLKTRIVPIPLHKTIWENLRANPVGVAYGEVYTAMQTNVIEAVEFNVSSIYAFKMYEIADYLTLTAHYYWPGLFFINKATYDGLSPEHQAAVVDSCRNQMPDFIHDAQANEEETLALLEEKGIVINEFTDRRSLLKLTAPVFEEWSKKDPLIAEYIQTAKETE